MKQEDNKQRTPDASTNGIKLGVMGLRPTDIMPFAVRPLTEVFVDRTRKSEPANG